MNPIKKCFKLSMQEGSMGGLPVRKLQSANAWATSPCGALQRGEKAPGSVRRMHHPLAYIGAFFISLSQGKNILPYF